ncbi:MAG: VCBS repeat-containing protein [Planctomycetota bacterium]
MRLLKPCNSVRLSALVATAGLPCGVLGQVDCDANGVPDAVQSLLWVASSPASQFSNALSWQNIALGTSEQPQPSSLCIFNPGLSGVDPAIANIGADALVGGVSVASGEVRFPFTGGRVLSVAGVLPGCREVAVGTDVGKVASIVGTGSGGFDFGWMTIGAAPQSVGTVSLLSPSVTLAAGPSVIGGQGAGSVTSSGSPVVFRSWVSIGEDSTGMVDIAGPSAELFLLSDVVDSVVVGGRDHGTLRVRGGAAASTGGAPIELIVGDEAGSLGSISLAGLGTVGVFDTTTFEVGRFGSAQVSVRAGATLRTGSPGGVVLGRESGSLGEVTLIDGVWEETAAPVFVGRLGDGRLQLDEDAEFIGDLRVLRRGTLAGAGRITGPATIAGGRLRPGTGAAARQLVVDGHLSFRGLRPSNGLVQSGRLEVTVDGIGPGDFDAVLTTQVGELAGTLAVRADAALSLQIGSSITVLEANNGVFGTFAAVNVPVFESGTTLAVEYGPTDVVLRVVAAQGRPPEYAGPRGFIAAQGLSENAAVAGDVTGDDRPDLIIVASGSDEGQLVVLENLGVDSAGDWLGFAPPAAFGTIEQEPVGVALGDIDQDGLPDAVFVNKTTDGAGVVRVRLNSPTAPGDFGAIFGTGVVIENDPVDLALSDLNDDGIPDPAVAGIVPGSSQQPLPGNAGRRSSTGRVTTVDLTVATADDIDVGVQPGSIETYTSDQPGATDDIAVTCTGEGVVIVLRNDGAGAFPTTQVVSVGVDPTGLDTGDVDGDGRADLLTTNTASGTVSIARSIPSSSPISFDTAVSFATDDAEGSEPVSGVWSDLDGDGDLDIALIARDDGGVPRIRRLIFDGLGANDELRFQSVVDAAPPATGEPVPIELLTTDVDGDGTEDLVVIYADAAGSLSADRMSRIVPLPTADVGVRLGQAPCPADIAMPFGLLDLADIDAFITAFSAADLAADLAPPFGLLDLADIDVFITSYLAGCP